MKCVILAGGRGTRISEESQTRPKPMIEIGSKPILWHIMKLYSYWGIDDFVVCLGYRGYMIKEYFANYYLHESDVTVDLEKNDIAFYDSRSEPWRVTLVDTGENTLTGGRVRRVRKYLDPEEPFFVTYGDGVSDVDVSAQLKFHRSHGRLVTMTVVRPPARYGSADIDGDRVISFAEKPQASEGLINGGFFVFSYGALDYIQGDETPLESTPLEELAAKDELRAWRHQGFWQAMDTLRDKILLEEMWDLGRAPWKLWI